MGPEEHPPSPREEERPAEPTVTTFEVTTPLPGRVEREEIATGLTSALALYAVASFALSAVLRVVHRGAYYPGWDILGAANGLFMVSTQTVRELAVHLATRPYDSLYAWDVEGILAVIPGWLTAQWPSEYWAHAITPVVVATALWLLARAIDLRWRDGWVLLLAWGASSALVSWSITGLPYISCVLPYALALWAVLRWQERVDVTILIAAFACLLSWHVQEIGRTVFLVFFAATLLLPGAPWTTRAAWLLCGVGGASIVFANQNFNSGRFAAMEMPGIADLREAVVGVVGRWLTAQIDLPALPIAAAAAVALTGRRRWFWGALLALHAGLILLVAANHGTQQGVLTIWPRRTLLFSFLCVATVVAAWRERPRAARWVIALLLVGNLWQLADTVRWSRAPFQPRWEGQAFTLPYVHSTLDYWVPFAPVDWSAEMRARVEAGRKLFLIYNLSAFDENPTNPAAVLERLYLSLGHQRFIDSVLVFGTQSVRWDALPIRPMETVDATVDGIEDPAAYDVYRLSSTGDDEDAPVAERYRGDVAALMAAIERHFELVPGTSEEDDHHRRVARFTLRPRVSP